MSDGVLVGGCVLNACTRDPDMTSTSCLGCQLHGVHINVLSTAKWHTADPQVCALPCRVPQGGSDCVRCHGCMGGTLLAVLVTS
jgi:hypothetical protein